MDGCFLNIAQGTNDINKHNVILRAEGAQQITSIRPHQIGAEAWSSAWIRMA